MIGNNRKVVLVKIRSRLYRLEVLPRWSRLYGIRLPSTHTQKIEIEKDISGIIT